jgi:hypothetical protein
MSDELRNSLWNVLDELIFNRRGFLYSQGDIGEIDSFSRSLWFHHFKKPIDSRPGRPPLILAKIRDYFLGCEWYAVYDFLEFLVHISNSKVYGADLCQGINLILESELAGFRLVSGVFVPVTDEQEVAAVQAALEQGPYKGVTAHLQQALQHLSSKPRGDYRNSIKESISAVESLARELTGNPKATLGDALGLIEKTGKLHPALKKGLSALYGYTSDEHGIRHAMLEEPDISSADAKFFLVSCAAFVNYLKSKAQ